MGTDCLGLASSRITLIYLVITFPNYECKQGLNTVKKKSHWAHLSNWRVQGQSIRGPVFSLVDILYNKIGSMTSFSCVKAMPPNVVPVFSDKFI